MNKNRVLYGSLGLLSLLGIIGIISKERIFLSFFCFAINLRYFLINTDEMMEEYMNKSAAISFYVYSFTLMIITLINVLIIRTPIYESLVYGLTISWVVSIIVYTLLVVIYEFKENKGLEDD